MRLWDAIGVAFFLGAAAAWALAGGLRWDVFVAAVVGWLLGYAVRLNYEKARR